MNKVKNFGVIGILLVLLMVFSSSIPVIAAPGVGDSDNGILVEEWRYDMQWYAWGWFGSSPAIADLGPSVNTVGGEPDTNLEIMTGSDEIIYVPPNSYGVWRTFDSGGNLEWQLGTRTDESRSSLAIADIDGDGDLELTGGTTSGWYVEVIDHLGNFVWTFPTYPGVYSGGPFVWPSSPAVCEIDPAVSGLEVVIGNNPLGNVWAFDGDNSDGIDDGITIAAADFPSWPYPLGTEGTDWDVLWKFNTGGPVIASPACGDVDNDGTMEVVIGSTDGNVYVLDGPTGGLEYAFVTGSPVYASAALANLDDDAYLEIVVGSTNGIVYYYQWDGTTGSTEGSYTTGGAVYSSAAIGDIDDNGDLEIIVGSNDGNVYTLDDSASLEWSYATGGAVYSSPALANRGEQQAYKNEWPMFRHDACRTGFYGPSSAGLDIYIGSDDGYLYLLHGSTGLMIDRFQVYTGSYPSPQGGIHTSPSVADVDGDKNLEIFFYDWGQGSAYSGHTFWALEDQPPITVEKSPIMETDLGDEDNRLEPGERWEWIWEITVTNVSLTTINDVKIKDNLGAELELLAISFDGVNFTDVIKPPGKKADATILGVEVWWTGKSEKVHWSYDGIGDLDPGDEFHIWLKVATDQNPGGKQEYTSLGEHCQNSGATAKGLFQGWYEVEGVSEPICIEVLETD